MIDAINAVEQTVAANGSVLFGAARIQTGCSVRHEAGSGRFIALKPGIYSVTFVGNIAIPTGGAVDPISVALSVDGETVAGTEAVYSPAAVEQFGNVAISMLVRVYPCGGGGVSIGVVNTSGEPILVDNANLVILRECGGDAL